MLNGCQFYCPNAYAEEKERFYFVDNENERTRMHPVDRAAYDRDGRRDQWGWRTKAGLARAYCKWLGVTEIPREVTDEQQAET